MSSHAHGFIAEHHLVARTRLLALLLALPLGNASAHSGGTLSCPTGTCRITQDQTYESVIIGSQAVVEVHNHTLTITGAGGLTCNGTLSIGDEGTLVISGGGTHSVNGSIRLKGDDSTLRLTSNATLSDDSEHEGQVIGEHHEARIEINQSVTLTSLLDMRGAMTIAGGGTLYNKDSVTATDSDAECDMIVLASDLHLRDVGGAVWEADGGILQFDHAQTGNCKLVGDIFLVHGGALVFNESITIDDSEGAGLSLFYWNIGTTQSPSTLIVADGAVFTYIDFLGGACANPDTSGPPPFTIPGPALDSCP